MESHPPSSSQDQINESCSNLSYSIVIQPPPETQDKILNINIGILGHVDSGKTSLSKLLSTIASTAAFDKNPQSKERGITLDLGFSAFYIKTPEELKAKYALNKKLQNSESLQFTWVDCPGHASLIKTVIAGSNIIDTVILVIDAIKGIQAQTIECIILSEILCDKISIAFNKVDLIKTENELQNKMNKLHNAFSKTKFGENIPIVPITATLTSDNQDQQTIDKYGGRSSIHALISNLLNCINFDMLDYGNTWSGKENFLAFIDHCFAIKNKGTIATGTIIHGTVKINDDIFFPDLSTKKQVKEIQVFKKPVLSASRGDRVGMWIKNLDSTMIERTIVCSPSSNEVSYCEGGLFIIKKIKMFKQEITSNSKFYVMIGNQGVTAKCLFFSPPKGIDMTTLIKPDANIKNITPNLQAIYGTEYIFSHNISDSDNEYYLALLRFDTKALIPSNMVFIGSKIDIDISEKTNRLAFYGKMWDTLQTVLPKLKICKMKTKEGNIIRVIEDGKVAVIKGLFKKDGHINDFIGRKVVIKQDKNIEGRIASTFGSVGKVKVEFKNSIEDWKITDINGNALDVKAWSVEWEYKKYIKLI